MSEAGLEPATVSLEGGLLRYNCQFLQYAFGYLTIILSVSYESMNSFEDYCPVRSSFI